MTLRRFFLDYLWPLDTYSVSRTMAGMGHKQFEKQDSGEISEEAAAGSREMRTAKKSTKNIRLSLQIQLRSDIRVYARRWFALSLILFAMAWASSFILTMLGCLAGGIGFALLGVRHYIEDDRTAADGESSTKSQSPSK